MKDLDFCNWAINEIGNHYGLPLQKGKAIEELGELIVALQKDILSSVISSDNDNTLSDEIVDEIADVTIVLKQLIKLSGSEDKLNKRIVYKLTRQLDRLKMVVGAGYNVAQFISKAGVVLNDKVPKLEL